MSTGYKIDFTYDPGDARSFLLQPYSTNGTQGPNTELKDSKAATADTTLLLYGKGMANYGERIQENMVHMLENFSSPEEPVRPISGQLWNDISAGEGHLRVYNTIGRLITSQYTDINNAVWITIDAPVDAEDQSRVLARLSNGRRIRVHSGQSQESYTIGANATLNGAVIEIQISPTPSSTLTGWYIGDWEYVIQNNMPLKADLSAGNDYTVVDVRDPTNAGSRDAVPASWVTAQIVAASSALSSSIDVLDDVTITNANDDDILIYSGGQWENTAGNTLFLPLTGGALTGPLDMNSNAIQGLDVTGVPLNYPSAPHHAASKAYVDQEVASVSGGIVNSLGGLSDVVIASPAVDHILSYTGTQWENGPIGTLPFLPIGGGNLTGDLTLSGPTHQGSGGLAATEDYVDTEVADALSAAQIYTDNQFGLVPLEDYVDSGSYDVNLQELTLNRLQGGTVTIAMATTAATTADVTHATALPNIEPLITDYIGSPAMDEWFYDTPTYPNITVDNIITNINELLGEYARPKSRIVFTANGNSTIFLGDSSGGAVADQINPTGDLTPEFVPYVVGHNNLEIYVNGVKQVASTYGLRRVEGDAGYRISKGTRTGLGAGPYTFDITVDGGSAVTISVPGTTSIGELVNEINDVADANYWGSGTPDADYAFSCDVLDGFIIFYSGNPGASSSITLVDGTLFAALVGDAGTTGTFTASIGDTQTYPPATYGYDEVGPFGQPSEEIVFTSAPPSGAVIEVIVDHKMFSD